MDSSKTNSNIQDKTRWLEISLVVITGICKFIFMDWLEWRLPYITIACLFWIGYIVKRIRQDASILQYWGLSLKNFNHTFLELFPVGIISILLFIFIGNKMGTNILSWHILPLLILYPIWGIIQQFIIVGLIAGNLRDLENIHLPFSAIVGITATIFAVVHYPFLLLILGTFFLAIVYTTLYLKNRNLIVFGIYHGWIGAFFFYTILARDPWIEVFGNIF